MTGWKETAPRLLALSWLSAVAACSDATGPVDARSALVEFRANAPSYVTRITAVFKGGGITDSLLFTVPVVTGTAFDTFELQAGSGISVIVNAYDSASVNTHRGDTTITLLPGLNSPLRLVLEPLIGSLPIEVDFGSPQDWVFQVDVKPVSISFGMGLGLILFDSALGVPAARAQGLITLFHTGSDLPLFFVADAVGNIYRSSAPVLGTWYTIRVAFNAATSKADILITNLATGAQFFRQDAVAFSATTFNAVGLGATTAAGDGTSAEMHYDNISVSRGGVLRCSLEFSTAPSVTLTTTPVTGDSYDWDSTSGIYKVKLAETVTTTDKYAVASLC